MRHNRLLDRTPTFHDGNDFRFYDVPEGLPSECSILPGGVIVILHPLSSAVPIITEFSVMLACLFSDRILANPNYPAELMPDLNWTLFKYRSLTKNIY